MSENAPAVFGRTPEEIWSRPFGDLIGPRLLASLEGRVDADGASGSPLNVGVGHAPAGGAYDCLVHAHGGYFIVELEAIERPSEEPEDFPTRMIDVVAALEHLKSFRALSAAVAAQVRELLAFDRVLIYRFDANWNGLVVAEARNGRLPSYQGLRFPASDIPAQARELYRTNRSRIIPDVHYRPVPILSSDPAAGPLDLTYSTLRSVSPVHLEYMKNMGTPASASFSILRGGRLWGLIACHNAEPRMVRYGNRRLCELLAQTYSLQIAAVEGREDVEERVVLNEMRSQLLRSVAAATTYAEVLTSDPENFLGCMRADGAAIVSEAAVASVGQAPSEEAIRGIAGWLAGTASDDVYSTNTLAAAYPPAAAFASEASGLVAVPISRGRGSFVLWFRREVAQTVTWAGDPHRAKIAGPYESSLHPRASFEAWKEIVRGQAEPWTEAQLATAAAVRNDIVGIVLRQAETLAALNAELERSNKELEAFSYSVSHDLRAPFRHIVGYSELISELEGANLSDRGQRHLRTVLEAGRNAGRLIDSLLLFAQMGRNPLNLLSVDMNRLVEEVRAEVVAAEPPGRAIEWTIGDLPPARADPTMLRLVLRNLIANAVKYTRKRPVAHIAIDGEVDDDWCTYHVRDDGVGFDMAFAHKLFGVFQRLHSVEDFEGTGIGLANVRRIVARHGGNAWANGEADVGSAFHFTLPREAATPQI